MSSISEKKQELRESVLQKREAYSEESWRFRSEKILTKILSSDIYKSSQTIHTYVSMNERREVWTDPLINHIFEDDKMAVVPTVNFSDGTLSHHQILTMEELKANNWGVREPETRRPVDISELDMVVVPMAAGDRAGNRLGYGRGFYDRFLAQTPALKIGLTFQDFLFDTIPVEEFDVNLDMIITEEEVILP